MISCTLKQYTDNYNSNLSNYLQEYEDNTKAFFLQNEKVKYQNYQNALSKISNQLQLFTREELNNNLVFKSIATDLKNICPEAYNKIIIELNQTPNDGVLSLSNLKNDKISINEKELENHLKSSIVILKYISQEYEETIQIKTIITKDESGEVALLDSTEYQIDQRLELWLKKYENENEYIHIPKAIEEKRSWVTDKYMNYEERYYKSQIDICNAILNAVPNENEITTIKTEFKNKLIDLRKGIPLPDTEINKLISEINNAFYRLEKFMKGIDLEYNAYYFNDAFTLLFNEMNKLENKSASNDALINGYYTIINQIYYDYDKSDFLNTDAYENEDFNRDCNEIEYLAFNRYEEFNIDEDGNGIKISISQIANNVIAINETIEIENKIALTNKLENPYPRIFTSINAFYKFKNLLDEFGNGAENIANYSFVFHKMKRDRLIFDDYQQTQFIYFLLDFDINIRRIKPKSQLGKTELRESIYNKVKNTLE
ncbi:hypothetical protein [Flavobacterium sp.]|jgi:hypothetical protein|uniref:hypothetical protein n=1 Tax=Flavobacterium sp. TaxID=239 RepID=UPI0037BF694D